MRRHQMLRFFTNLIGCAGIILLLLCAPAEAASVRTEKPLYASNEPIIVFYQDFPGNKSDWMTIMPANAPDNTYEEWQFTNGSRSGRFRFRGLPAGTYEVRGYYNWDDTETYTVQTRYRFTIR